MHLKDWQTLAAEDLARNPRIDLDINQAEDLAELALWLPNIEELILISSVQTTLPADLGKLCNLRFLEIRMPLLQKLCPEIGMLTRLQELLIHKSQLREIPDSIGLCTQLKTLRIEENEQLHSLPETLAHCQNLRSIFVLRSGLRQMPCSIGNCIGLTQLYLAANQLQSLPDSLLQLDQLELLSVSDNQLQALPPIWAHFPKLKRLEIANNPFLHFPYEVLEMKQLESWHLEKNFYSWVNDAEWLTDFRKKTHSPQQRKSFYLLYQNYPDSLPKDLPRADLWAAMQMTLPMHIRPAICELLAAADAVDFDQELPKKGSSFAVLGERKNKDPEPEWLPIYHQMKYSEKPSKQSHYILLADKIHKKNLPDFYPEKALFIQEKQLDALWIRLQKEEEEHWKNKALPTGTPLAFLGNFAFSRTELKEKLSAQGLVYQPKILADTQVIVLGRGVKKTELLAITQSSMPYLREDTLYRKLEQMQPPLPEELRLEKQQETQQLSDLLGTFDESNAGLALTMLDKLGDPKALLTELFCIAKHHKYPASIRQKARQLIEQHGSARLREKMTIRKHFFSPFYGIEYKDFKAHFDFFIKGTELDFLKICHYWNNFFDTSYIASHILYWVKLLETPSIRQEWFSFFIKKRSDWFLVYDEWKDLVDLSQCTDIQYFKLSYKIQPDTQIPDIAFQQRQLKALDLSNSKISQLPDQIQQLWALEELNLEYTPLAVYPLLLEKMIQLQRIYVSNTPWLKAVEDGIIAFESAIYTLEYIDSGSIVYLQRK